ncbi:MAG: hypothetical protein ACYC91_18015 [Solirubrobacteraceae bacterium]
MRTVPALLALGATAAIAGCGSSHSSTPNSAVGSQAAGRSSATSSAAASPTTSAAVNPNAPETLPPGDIPDTIAYVPYAVPGHGLRLSTPEGWSRRSTPNGVLFTDKLNTVQLVDTHASEPITVASARHTEVPKFAAILKGFKLQSVSVVSRPAGPAVTIKYLGYSRPDPVTGKFGVLAFERYEFFHEGREVSLVLSSPLGSDNVDPWRNVTSSLRFTK